MLHVLFKCISGSEKSLQVRLTRKLRIYFFNWHLLLNLILVLLPVKSLLLWLLMWYFITTFLCMNLLWAQCYLHHWSELLLKHKLPSSRCSTKFAMYLSSTEGIISNPLESTCGLGGLSDVHSISHNWLGVVCFVSWRVALYLYSITKKHIE